MYCVILKSPRPRWWVAAARAVRRLQVNRKKFFARKSSALNSKHSINNIDGRHIGDLTRDLENVSVTDGWLATFIAGWKQPSYLCLTYHACWLMLGSRTSGDEDDVALQSFTVPVDILWHCSYLVVSLFRLLDGANNTGSVAYCPVSSAWTTDQSCRD